MIAIIFTMLIGAAMTAAWYIWPLIENLRDEWDDELGGGK